MTAAIQLLPTPDAEEAILVLGRLVAARAPDNLDDAYFERDWSALWQDLAEAGWTACADGPGAGADGDFTLLDLAAIAEMWGGHLVPLPLVPTLVTRRWLDERPDATAKLSYLARESDFGLISHGEDVADVLTATGLKARSSLGPAREIDRFAPSLPMSLIAGGTAPADAAMRQEAAILAASEAVGAAARVLQVTVDYARVREQFGKPIGSFQAIKHILANAHARIELSRSAIAWCCTERAATAEATRAALEHCLRVAEDCVQAHGGIGFTWAAPPHRYYRHIMATRRLVAAAVRGD